jgi:Ala-tRNA(Pro) deacylase
MLMNRLTKTLTDNAIGFEIIHHRQDYSALEAAEDTHTAGSEFAKCVVVDTEEGPALAVLPAPRMVDFARFSEVVGGEVRLANENRIAELFPDCQVGAEPPFGHLYDLPVYVDEELAGEEYITFNAGSHDEAVRILYRDYERLEHPTHARFAAPEA